MHEPPPHPRRIAVIGSGIGGLTAAWLLRRLPSTEVTLFEQHARPGMGVFGVDYTSRGLTTRIDIPTRVFCEGYYPQLFGLLQAIGVRMQATDHAAAYADGDGRVFFHYGNVNVFGRSLTYLRPGAGGPWRQAQALGVARDSVRFFAVARRDLERDPHLGDATLREYLAARRYASRFVRSVLLPTLSVICTCDIDSVLEYPADIVLAYLTSGVMKQGVLRAELGVEGIVTRMVEGMSLVCGAEVRGLVPASSRTQGGASGYVVQTADGSSPVFDRVVLATQAHQAAQIVDGCEPASASLLRRIPFERSVMRVHTDEGVLPRALLGWPLSPVTYHLPEGAARPEVTVDLTQAFGTYRGQAQVFQTWNPLRPVRDDRVLAEATFTRPLVTHDSRRAAGELRRLQSQGGSAPGLLFCGAYMGDRVPLLEAAVESAVAAAVRLGATTPWSTTPAHG